MRCPKKTPKNPSGFAKVHFNFGLHDLVDPGPGEGKEHVDLPQYGANLVTIYRRLQTIVGEPVDMLLYKFPHPETERVQPGPTYLYIENLNFGGDDSESWPFY